MFNWFRRSRHYQVLDSFALLDKGKWGAVRQAIEDVREGGRPVFVVAHFTETFEVLQGQLEQWDLEYEIRSEPITAASAFREQLFESPGIYLVLAEMIKTSDNPNPLPFDQNSDYVSWLVCERHPLSRTNRKLADFFVEVNVSTRAGHFLSLQDPLLQTAVGERAITVMKQFGLSEHELINSQLLTRRIEKFSNKLDKLVIDERRADGPQEWLELNFLSREKDEA